MTRYGLDMMALMHGNDGNARYGARCSFTMLHKVTGFTNVSPAKVLTMCSAHLELLGGQQAIAVGIQGLKGLPQHLPGSTESKHVETCRNMSKPKVGNLEILEILEIDLANCHD